MLKDMIKRIFIVNKKKFLMSFFLVLFIFLYNSNGYLIFDIVKDVLLNSDNGVSQHNIYADEQEVTVNSIAQKMLTAINQQNEVVEVFKSLSDEEKNGISLAEFSQYINCLKKGHFAKLTSFYKVSEKDRKILDKDINSHISDQAYLDSLDFYFFDSEDVTKRILFPFEINQKGNYCIATKYIHEALDLYSYANLYFSALRNKDKNTLKKLIYTDYNDDTLLDIKVDNILRFYSMSDDVDINRNMDLLVFRFDSIAFQQNNGDVNYANSEVLKNDEILEKNKSINQNVAKSKNILRESQTFFQSSEFRMIWIIRKNDEVKVIDKINSLDDYFSTFEYNGSEYKMSDIYTDFDRIFINGSRIHLSFDSSAEVDDAEIKELLQQNQLASFDYYENFNYRMATIKFKSGIEKLLFLAVYPNDNSIYQKNNLKEDNSLKSTQNGVNFNSLDKLYDTKRIDFMKKYMPFLDVNRNQESISDYLNLKVNFNADDKIDYLNFYTEEWLEYGAIFNKLFSKMN